MVFNIPLHVFGADRQFDGKKADNGIASLLLNDLDILRLSAQMQMAASTNRLLRQL